MKRPGTAPARAELLRAMATQAGILAAFFTEAPHQCLREVDPHELRSALEYAAMVITGTHPGVEIQVRVDQAELVSRVTSDQLYRYARGQEGHSWHQLIAPCYTGAMQVLACEFRAVDLVPDTMVTAAVPA